MTKTLFPNQMPILCPIQLSAETSTSWSSLAPSWPLELAAGAEVLQLVQF